MRAYGILRNFVLFFWDFNGGSSPKEDLQMIALKSEEKMMRSVHVGDFLLMMNAHVLQRY